VNFDQLNSITQLGVKSELGRTNVEKIFGEKFTTQEEYELRAQDFLYFLQKQNNQYQIRFLGINARGEAKEGVILDSNQPKWFVKDSVIGSIKSTSHTHAKPVIKLSVSQKAAISRNMQFANAGLME